MSGAPWQCCCNPFEGSPCVRVDISGVDLLYCNDCYTSGIVNQYSYRVQEINLDGVYTASQLYDTPAAVIYQSRIPVWEVIKYEISERYVLDCTSPMADWHYDYIYLRVTVRKADSKVTGVVVSTHTQSGGVPTAPSFGYLFNAVGEFDLGDTIPNGSITCGYSATRGGEAVVTAPTDTTICDCQPATTGTFTFSGVGPCGGDLACWGPTWSPNMVRMTSVNIAGSYGGAVMFAESGGGPSVHVDGQYCVYHYYNESVGNTCAFDFWPPGRSHSSPGDSYVHHGLEIWGLVHKVTGKVGAIVASTKPGTASAPPYSMQVYTHGFGWGYDFAGTPQGAYLPNQPLCVLYTVPRTGGGKGIGGIGTMVVT